MIRKEITRRLRLAASDLWTSIKAAAQRIMADPRKRWALKLAGRWLIVLLALGVYALIVARTAQKKALDTYAVWMQDYRAEQAYLAEVAAQSAPQDPYEAQLDREAEALARVLYGVRDNDTDDLRTACWCVFNRVDNSAFPDDLDNVIAQPDQWMRYHETNPILEPLYQVAREELDRWHSESHRPVSADYVFLSWSSRDICLRDNWAEGSGTHYWRWGQ